MPCSPSALTLGRYQLTTIAPGGVARQSAPAPWARTALRWAPAVLGFVACLAMLKAFSTPVTSALLYSIYLLLAAAIPGTLLWRMLRTRPKSFIEEVAAGTTLGLSIQTALVWALTWLGAPRLAPLWVVVVVTLCIVHPRLRPLWRSQADARNTPIWLGWALAAISTLACWWVVNTDWSNEKIAPIPGLPGQWYAVAPQQDMYFQQGLTAAVLRGATHFPSIAAVPLKYELMASYQLADAARWTGIDLTLVVFRLATFPLLILAILLCAAIAHRLTKSAAGAVLGAGFAYFTSPPPLWAGTQYPLNGVSTLNLGVYRSVTQTFGQPIFHLVLLLLIVILSRKRINYWHVVAFAVAAFVVGGAKATFLPMVFCAVAAALVVGWVLKSHRSGRIVAVGAISVVAFVAALVLVLGTASRGLKPSLQVTVTHWSAFAHLLHTATSLHVSVAKAVFLIVGWSFGVAAVVLAAVLKRRSLGVWILLAVAVSGVGGTLLTAHPTDSQIWFIRGAWPLAGTLAGVGVYEAVKVLHVRRRVGVAVGAAAMLAGFGASLIVRHSFAIPTVYDFAATWVKLFLPYVMLILAAVIAGCVAAGVWIVPAVRRHMKGVGLIAVGLIIAVLALQGSGAAEMAVGGLLPQGQTTRFPALSADGAYAARWVRDHSSVNDTIATNMHCLGTSSTPAKPPVDSLCTDARHFSLAALSERQVLLEGWDYAPAPTNIAPDWDSGPATTRFWDPKFLAENDAAITDSTPATTAWLRAHSVDWIIVDRSVSHESPNLKDYAKLVLVKGSFAVYRLNGS